MPCVLFGWLTSLLNSGAGKVARRAFLEQRFVHVCALGAEIRFGLEAVRRLVREIRC